MSKQEINIQNNSGTINIYNTENEEDKENKKISMAAVDKYSSPLTADIMLSPWGENLYRVSFLLKNDLIGQVLQRNYITFKTKESAKEFFTNLASDIDGFKKQAELGRKHSVLIVADIWNLMQNYEKKYSVINQPESLDLRKRYNSDSSHENFVDAKPYGLVFHDVENHFHQHEGIVKKAGKESNWDYEIENLPEHNINVVSEINSYNKYLSEIGREMLDCSIGLTENVNEEKLKIAAQLALPRYSDIDISKNQKTKILLALKSIFNSNVNIDNWILLNNNIIERISETLGEMGMNYYASKYKKITQDDYDVFIFDADKTLWDGEKAYEMNSPFTFEENTVTDSNGKKIVLKDGVRSMLAGLFYKDKKIGLISHSEKSGVQYQDQPVIQILKGFNILGYFKEMIVIAHDFPKSMFIPNEKRVLFVDDDIRNIIDVTDNTNADATLPEDVVYNPNNLEENIVNEESVKVSSILEHVKDFIPLYVYANPHLLKKDDKYWEQKEKDVLDEYWYSSEEIDTGEFQQFLETMVSNGIQENTTLEPVNRSIPPTTSSLSVLLKLTESGKKKVISSYSKISGRPRIKAKEIPDKPKGKGHYELDHKIPRWKKGTDTKENLEWVKKDKHKKKTKEEGSYEYGGKDRHKRLKKEKGKEGYSDYQSETAKTKIKKEREELGERAFSEKQRERAKKRWSKHSSTRLDSMKISSWIMDKNGLSRLTAGELDVLFAVQEHPLFEKIIDKKSGEVFLEKIKDLVWNLDELFIDAFLMSSDEEFKNYCKNKSENENISYVDCLKGEVEEYQVSSSKINGEHIVLDVIRFLEPKLQELLTVAQSANDDDERIEIFNAGARNIYEKALIFKEQEIKDATDLHDVSFTDTMKFKEKLHLDEYNNPTKV